MRNPISIAAFGTLILGILAWAGVWLLFSDVSNRLTERATTLSNSSVQNVRQASAVELQALVNDTVTQRGALDAAVNTDVVGIAAAISNAGQEAGVQTTIGSASLLAPTASSSPGVNVVEFVVQATGTFQQVWRAAQLFQSLPLPSNVSELDFEQIPNAVGRQPTWQLTAHINILTTAQISS